MTPEELKDSWKNISQSAADRTASDPSAADRSDIDRSARAACGDAPDPVLDDVIANRAVSARDRLIRRYRIMWSVIAPVGVIALLPVIRFFPLWVFILDVAYFAVAAIMSYSLYDDLRNIDLSREGVAGMAIKARRLRKRHLGFEMALIPFMCVVLWCYFHFLGDIPGMYEGMLAGLGIGLFVGLLTLFRFLRDYKSIID